MTDLFSNLLEWLSAFTTDDLLEWSGVLTGITAIFLTAKRHLLCWPIGMINVIIYGVFFYRINLYADAGLQGFYFLTCIYGWWHWARGGENHAEAPVRSLTGRERLIGTAAVTVAIIIIWTALKSFTNASYPFWDTVASCLSVAAQLLVMRKILDNWVIWLFVNIISICLYLAKAAYPTAALYAIFLILALVGYNNWRKALSGQAVVSSAA
ncbi:MAG: nicotinamide riboside transporter PnuC [Verrucomicrobiota bacterium]|nr:nicotinamide riboside transporter PnuC [Verrucomicrobiota bacterium]